MATLPSLRHKIGATVTPGDRIGLASTRGKTTLIAGKGTYIRQGHVYTSLVGKLYAAIHKDDDNNNNNEDDDDDTIGTLEQMRTDISNNTLDAEGVIFNISNNIRNILETELLQLPLSRQNSDLSQNNNINR